MRPPECRLVLWLFGAMVAAVALMAGGLHHRAHAAPPRGQAVVGESVNYVAADAAAIVTANVAVTLFNAAEIQSGCDIINPGPATLYVDFTTVAVAGASTAIPIAAGGAYHCPYPPLGAISAVAASAQTIVAVRY